jgi:hypothetical protein
MSVPHPTRNVLTVIVRRAVPNAVSGLPPASMVKAAIEVPMADRNMMPVCKKRESCLFLVRENMH